MADVRVIGLAIAKSVFQMHGIDAVGATVLQKRLTRSRLLPFFEKLPACLIGIEACATSHFWARELTKLGHEVKLMPAQYVKPYVKRQKNDISYAEAICEAVTGPTMRFVGQKSPDQQSAMMLHKVRLMLNRQLIMLSNAIRAHMAEFGVVAPVGPAAFHRSCERSGRSGPERQVRRRDHHQRLVVRHHIGSDLPSCLCAAALGYRQPPSEREPVRLPRGGRCRRPVRILRNSIGTYLEAASHVGSRPCGPGFAHAQLSDQRTERYGASAPEG
ncbi:MAG: hypothetical protein ACK4SZ_00070 [Allosphingosinicella sp.]